MILVVLFVIWMVFALIPAVVAERKGRSALGFFLFALFLTPLLALIVALIIDPARDHVSKADRQAAKIAAEDAAYRVKAEEKYRAQ